MSNPTPTLLVLASTFLLAARAPAAAQVLTLENYGTQCTLGNGFSQIGRPAPGGRWLVHSSTASNLVPNDANASMDVFLRDRWTRTTTCISVDPNGAPGNGHSIAWRSVTPDARWAVFESGATNLVAGDTNGWQDVFVRDLSLATTVRVSLATGGAQANAGCSHSSISDDGRFVAFFSQASDLVAGDSGTGQDIFLHDRDPDADGIYDEGDQTTICVSTSFASGLPVNVGSYDPQVSADGSAVIFASPSSAIVPGDANGADDVFLWTRSSGTAALVSLATNGSQANGASSGASLSSDGLHVSFASIATNLVAGGDGNSIWDVYVRDLQTGTTELVSAGTTGLQGSYWSSISADGALVAFESGAQLVPEDVGDDEDVYLRDRQSGTTVLLTTGPNGSGLDPAMSSDGGLVAWTAGGSVHLLPGDTNSVADVYTLDRSGLASSQVPFCFGDGTSGPCPCGNLGLPGTGCAHSQGSAARLDAHGTTVPDRVVLAVHGEVSNALTVFLQGTAIVPASPFGDGLRCIGGELRRLNVTNAVQGDAFYPACPFPLSIQARSAELGDPISPGSTRYYMTYFRDPTAGFCPEPTGSTFNSSNAIALTW